MTILNLKKIVKTWEKTWEKKKFQKWFFFFFPFVLEALLPFPMH